MIPEHLQDLYDIPLRFKELRLAGAGEIDLEEFTFGLAHTDVVIDLFTDHYRRPRSWWVGLSYEETGISSLWHMRVFGANIHLGSPAMHCSYADFDDAWAVIIALVRGEVWSVQSLQEFFKQR